MLIATLGIRTVDPQDQKTTTRPLEPPQPTTNAGMTGIGNFLLKRTETWRFRFEPKSVFRFKVAAPTRPERVFSFNLTLPRLLKTKISKISSEVLSAGTPLPSLWPLPAPSPPPWSWSSPSLLALGWLMPGCWLVVGRAWAWGRTWWDQSRENPWYSQQWVNMWRHMYHILTAASYHCHIVSYFRMPLLPLVEENSILG